MNPPIELWARAFVATCVWELVVHAWTLRGVLPARVLVPVSIGLQLCTHPALWYVVPRFEPWWAWVTVAEIGVWLTEAALLGVVLWRRRVPRPAATGLGVTLAANLVSTGIGLLGWF